MKGQVGLSWWWWGENRTGGWQCSSDCVNFLFFFRARATLRDRAEACASDTLNVDYVTLYTAPPDFRESSSFILWMLWMWGLFSRWAERGCFRLVLHTRTEMELFFFLSFFWSFWNHRYSVCTSIYIYTNCIHIGCVTVPKISCNQSKPSIQKSSQKIVHNMYGLRSFFSAGGRFWRSAIITQSRVFLMREEDKDSHGKREVGANTTLTLLALLPNNDFIQHFKGNISHTAVK